MTKAKSNKKQIVIFVLVFLLPIVLAKFALEMDFFNKGATNKGQLLSPPIEYPELLRAETPIWRIFYVLPENCNVKCNNALYSINQTWQAVGKNRDRVRATIVVSDRSDPNGVSSLQEHAHIEQLNVQEASIREKFATESLDGIFVSDTLGNVILRYPVPELEQEAVLKSRDILADMKKLLKLSRIG